MKKCIYLTLCVFFLTNCNHFTSNIKHVKNSVLDFDQSSTIGEVLDNYKYFTHTEWEEFTTEQGKEVVQFFGYYEYTRDAIWWSGPKDDPNSYKLFVYGFDVEIHENKTGTISGIVSIQFLMNKDRRADADGATFNVAFVGHKGYSDERTISCNQCLSKIYANKEL